MPQIIISNFSKQLGNKVLFSNINLTLKNGIYGLVGRNGSGKSTFLTALNASERNHNHIQLAGSCQLFSQLLQIPNCNIAEYLGVDKQLAAFHNIVAGSSCSRDYETLQEQWHLPNDINGLLEKLGLPQNPFIKCNQLSGGQLTRLKLHLCFTNKANILLLDEPSNHLDAASKDWLITLLKNFKGLVLIASHDEQLLECADTILHIHNNSICSYALGYQAFKEYFANKQASLMTKMAQEKATQNKIKKIAKQNLERAAQRTAQGKKVRASGSQPKMLLDAKRNGAEKAKSRLIKMQQSRLNDAETRLVSLAQQQDDAKVQYVYLNQSENKKDKTLLTVNGWQCDFVNHQKLSFTVKQSSRIWLKGANASGKSTLLKSLAKLEETSPFIKINNIQVTYLDQSYLWLESYANGLDALMALSENLHEQEARSLLAAIGIKADKAFLNTRELSGGEKMKVAMLCVSYTKKDALLLLDEPDNHLDRESKTMLIEALNTYQGAYIIISHDNKLVAKLAINDIVEINSVQSIEVIK